MFDRWGSGCAGEASDGLDVRAASDDELRARARALEAARTALDAAEAQALAELEVRGSCDRDRGLSTGAWLAHEATLPGSVARSRVHVARVLQRHLTVVAEALAAGTIGWDHARVLVELANPRILDVVVERQELLLGLADGCRFEQWRAEVRALAREWDQDGGYDPNEDVLSNRLRIGSTLDGLTTMRATFTGDVGEVLSQAIEAKADQLYRQAVEDRAVCEDLVVPSRRTLRALALFELVRAGLAGDPDRRVPARPEVTLVVGAEDPSEVFDPDGVPLADGTTRVLRCDADVHALIVDRLGVPLDLARSVRWATEGQRRAVRRRDGGCVFPGCTARVAWCDAHHCVHWDGEGGATDVANLVCLCRHHHGVVHRRGWRVWLDADGWAAFRTPSSALFWGQRHSRQRAGPPPEPPPELDQPAGPGRRLPPVVIAPGRYDRPEDPMARAYARAEVLRRLRGLERAA